MASKKSSKPFAGSAGTHREQASLCPARMTKAVPGTVKAKMIIVDSRCSSVKILQTRCHNTELPAS